MEQRNNGDNKKAIFIMVGVALLVISLVGATYAFFNYTRTGNANNIRTGRIAFNAEQGDEVTLSDLFPISATGEITPETPGVGSVVIHVTGDTNYTGGLEYLVKAVNVTSASGGTSLPISINISYENNGNGTTIGTSDDNYFTNRGSTSSLYKVLSTDTISEGQNLVVGYIAPGATGIDGNIVIMAYLDASSIAITDTYPDVTYYEVNDNLTSTQISDCVSYLSGINATNAFCEGTGTISNSGDDVTFQEALDSGLITAAQKTYLVNQGIIHELYTDGTDTTWVDGRTVLTTDEWNALSSGGVSFQVKVEANEGVWVNP